MGDDNGNASSGTSTQLFIAFIGLLGVLGAGLLTNWDKIFPPRVQVSASDGSKSSDATSAGGTQAGDNKNAGGGTAGTNHNSLAAPVLMSPANGSQFSFFPRTTNLEWGAVPGAATYSAEVDCFQCCQQNAWCTDVGKSWKIQAGLVVTKYTFDWVGAQPGRWRVWATGSDGVDGPKSGWSEFTYTQ